jgi:propanol-preferring alcohol dehydrogenase
MKAVRMVEVGSPLEMSEVSIPSVGPNDVLVAVKAAGICHSDAHYRAGVSPVDPLPLTLGHEVAGVVQEIGGQVKGFNPGDRVCLHYMVTCGVCDYCNQGNEQFCRNGKMIGKFRDGGYAEYICLPARSVFRLADGIPFEQGAIMMCSSATALHAVKKARLQPGESAAVFGAGGLGVSAVQLALAYGASQVYAVDIQPGKLDIAEKLGAHPIDASQGDPVTQIRDLTDGEGVDVALELVGLPLTMDQAFRSLGVMGRAAIAGLTDQKFEIAPYLDLLNKEAEIIGVSDHLAQEIPELIEWIKQGKLDLSQAVTRAIPLNDVQINKILDELGGFSEDVRVVIQP